MDISTIGLILAALLTLAVFSYLIGDNPVYRTALYAFIGVASGYAALVVLQSVIIPHFVTFFTRDNINPEDIVLTLLPLIGSVMLFMKLFRRTSRYGNIAIGFLVGVGAAVAIGGALQGTLFPQVQAGMVSLDWAQPGVPGVSEGGWSRATTALITLLGTVFTLLYFYYGAKRSDAGVVDRPNWLTWAVQPGKIFVIITLAALYAGSVATAFTFLTERMLSLYDLAYQLFLS